MSGSGTGRVRATDAALAAIERLQARHGPLVFVQSGWMQAAYGSLLAGQPPVAHGLAEVGDA